MLRRLIPALLLSLTATATVSILPGGAAEGPPPGRDSRLFHLDAAGKHITGPAGHLPEWLGLQLASATTDQPQYWPNESVFLNVVLPGRGNAPVKVTVQKRDATPVEQTVTLDAEGVAVLTLLDGTTQRLQLGEYHADVATVDGKAKAHATFAVVEGTLGALSLGHEMKQVTSVAELDAAQGGWFLGNAASPGSRWGNGLSFKNQLRVDNEPYTGEVELVSRCMLAGCNGIPAGPGQKVRAVNGEVSATLDVGGHSGPFQVEFVTPYGSLRHQFEGSGHVERDMVLASGGMRWTHHAGLAPYDGTVQVPGRQVFVLKDAKPLDTDAFEVTSLVAVDRKLQVHVRESLDDAHAWVWVAQPDGRFEPKPQKIPAKLHAGDVVTLDVQPPYSLVTVGGMHQGALKEGWAMAFPPASWHVTVEAPKSGEPLGDLPVAVQVQGEDGQGAAVSGILEVYDNRVASASPDGQLASGVGDSVRGASSNIAGWQDPVEIEKERRRQEAEEKKAELEARKQQKREEREERQRLRAPSAARESFGSGGIGLRGMGAGGGGVGYGSASGRGMAAPKMRVGSSGSARPAPPPGHGDEAEGGDAVVRQGEKKVLACLLVHTGADGKALLHVALPPQTGRVTARFVALRGLDWGHGQADTDVVRTAWIEAALPQVFVPGAKLEVRVTAANLTHDTLQVQASGEGVDGTWTQPVPPGRSALVLPWAGKVDGTVTLVLRDTHGKVLDRRQIPVRSLGEQAVTWTRLAFGGDRTIALQPGDTAVAFAGPGGLMRGIVMNVVTATDSWFPHAEALAARIASRTAILHAISLHLLDDEGMAQTVRADLLRDVRDLRQRFFDPGSSQFRPWPGLQVQAKWTAWVAADLHAGLRHLNATKDKARSREAVQLLTDMLQAVDAGLAARKEDSKAAGFDPTRDGEETVAIEVDGQIAWQVVTDDAVQRFVIEQLAPDVDPEAELMDSRQLDKFRLLRAFERTGRLQLLTQAAKAAWLAGPKGRAAFDKLYQTVARGLILSQEPGMVQGPALLGGVYSQPMALVRFLELMMLAGERKASGGAMTVAGQKVPFGEAFTAKVAARLTIPEGAVVRIDRPGQVSMREGPRASWLTATLGDRDLAVAGRTELTIELGAGKDPLEYYALVAVPTTTAVRQTEDILSDYKGQLIHGQQGTGGAKMQVLAVPFRGSRVVKLWLEGLLPGTSPGYVVVRHLEKPEDGAVLPLPEVRVRRGEKATARR